MHTNNKRFSFAMMFALIAMLSFSMVACNDDDDSDSVILESFGPSPVVLGGQITFIGQNLDKVSSIEFPMGFTVSSFLEKSSYKIVVEATRDSAQAYEGYVILHTSQGDITTKTKIGYRQSALLDAFSPAEVKPGSELTIHGSYLSSVKSLTFQGGATIDAADFKTQMNGNIVVVVPLEAQSGKIYVSDGTSNIYSEQELKITLPSGSAISKSDNVYPGSDEITITGNDFDLITSISFAGGTEISIDDITVEGKTIKFVFPASASEGDIVAHVASGETIVIGTVESIIQPTIDFFGYDGKGEAFTDGTVYHLGSQVVLTGENLDLVKTVSFGNGSAIPSSVSEDKKTLYINIPPQATATNADGEHCYNDEAHSWGRLYSGWQNGFIINYESTFGKTNFVGYAYAEWGPCNPNGSMALAGDEKTFMAFVNTDEAYDFVTEVNFNGNNCVEELKTNGFISADLKFATSCPINIKYTNGVSKDIDCAKWTDWSAGGITVSATDLVEFPVVIDFPADEVAGHLIEITGINFTTDTKFEFINDKGVSTEVTSKGFNNANSYYVTLPQSLSGTYTLKVSNGDKSSEMAGVQVAGSMAVLWEGNQAIGWDKSIGGFDITGVTKLQITVTGSYGGWLGFRFQNIDGQDLWSNPQKDFSPDEGEFVLEITGDDIPKDSNWYVCGGTSGSCNVLKVVAIY